MEQYIPKSALVAKIESLKSAAETMLTGKMDLSYWRAQKCLCERFLSFINDLEVKEVDEQKERMSECPYRQVGCTMYEGHILECKGACSWVVDYPTLKRLKAQKGEEV